MNFIKMQYFWLDLLMANRPMKESNDPIQDTEFPSHGLLCLSIFLTDCNVHICTKLEVYLAIMLVSLW